jgi:hypothetical protein
MSTLGPSEKLSAACALYLNLGLDAAGNGLKALFQAKKSPALAGLFAFGKEMFTR